MLESLVMTLCPSSSLSIANWSLASTAEVLVIRLEGGLPERRCSISIIRVSISQTRVVRLSTSHSNCTIRCRAQLIHCHISENRVSHQVLNWVALALACTMAGDWGRPLNSPWNLSRRRFHSEVWVKSNCNHELCSLSHPALWHKMSTMFL